MKSKESNNATATSTSGSQAVVFDLKKPELKGKWKITGLEQNIGKKVLVRKQKGFQGALGLVKGT